MKLHPRSIEVERLSVRRAWVRLHAEAESRRQELGAEGLTVTTADEGDLVVACAWLSSAAHIPVSGASGEHQTQGLSRGKSELAPVGESDQARVA